MKKVATIILNWNGVGFLREFMTTVVRDCMTDTSELVVADNGSTDESLAFLAQNYPQVKILKFDQNYGFAEGYNRAIKAVEAEYVLLLNSDVETTPGFIEAMADYLDQNEDVAGCQPKIRAYNDRTRFEHAGACGGFIDRWGYPFCRGRMFATVEQDCGQYDSTTDVFWATGACLLIRRRVYLQAGGLDASFFAHQEEIDLCWRIRSRGLRLACVPQSVVYHVGGGTLSMNNPRKTFLNFRNNLLMIYKNEPRLFTVMAVRFFLDYLAAFVFLLKGDFKNFVAVFKARFGFWKMRKAQKENRKANMAEMTVKNIPEMYLGSVVLDYNLKQIHTFADWRQLKK